MNNLIVVSHSIHPSSFYLDIGDERTDVGHANALIYIPLFVGGTW
jgi:hypothetical protein